MRLPHALPALVLPLCALVLAGCASGPEPADPSPSSSSTTAWAPTGPSQQAMAAAVRALSAPDGFAADPAAPSPGCEPVEGVPCSDPAVSVRISSRYLADLPAAASRPTAVQSVCAAVAAWATTGRLDLALPRTSGTSVYEPGDPAAEAVCQSALLPPASGAASSETLLQFGPTLGSELYAAGFVTSAELVLDDARWVLTVSALS